MNQLILCVDSSIKGVSLALIRLQAGKSEVLSSCIEHSRYGSAGLLSQCLTQILKGSGYRVADIAKIVVSVGPGSFTGIKVGLAWCFGLSAPYGQKLGWLTVSALEEAARSLQRQEPSAGKVVSLLLPSTRTHGYLAHYRADKDESGSCLLAIGQESTPFGSPAEIFANSQVFIAGSWPGMEEVLGRENVEVKPLKLQELMDYGLRGMIHKASSTCEEVYSSELPKPRYLRKSTAEEKLEQQRG